MAQPASPSTQSPASDSLSRRSRLQTWLTRAADRISIGTKINCGYALALAIALVGTTTGLVLGRYYYERAKDQIELADSELGLLGRLQSSLLEIQLAQKAMVSQAPGATSISSSASELLEHTAEMRALFADLKEMARTNADEGLSSLLQKYDGVIETYYTQLAAKRQQLQQSDQIPTPTSDQPLEIAAISTPEAHQLDQFVHEFTELTRQAHEKHEQAELNQSDAAAFQNRLILGSMMLSTTIAAILATLTSRAITRPIKSLTRVTRQVTQDSNFELQAPVTTRDEVGTLAASFNQLIARVKCLLEEQAAAIERQQQMQETELIQNEKMSSLGRMLAGVAHEINNPVNFIYGNVVHANEYMDDLFQLLHAYKAIVPNPPDHIQDLENELDLEFLEEDLPKVLQSIQLGADRARQIVLSLKNFSRLDDTDAHPVDLHECIDSSLLLLNNRIKKGITITRNYGELPTIQGYANQLYQVFMNLLSNALDALDEAPEDNDKQITITTEAMDAAWVRARIQDNGPGMALEVQEKMFEAFFTTKPRGIGTGLGLAISHQIIVKKHGGRLNCTSDIGAGTEFTIELPIKHPFTVTPSSIVANLSTNVSV